jgi:nitrate/nitrite-specific signal transduction histidine kinase
MDFNKTQIDQIIRILRETFNNINKHSQALFFRFDLSVSSQNFNMQIKEGPIQSNPLPFKQGKGLKSMMTRAKI